MTCKSSGNFKYKTLEELEKDIREMELDIKVSENLDLFKTKVNIGDYIIPNSIASLPMEGGDSTEDGKPTELTYRKYKRIAKGGAGLRSEEHTSELQSRFDLVC